MARDLNQMIKEEEEREVEEAFDLEEQENPKEYDDGDENTAVSTADHRHGFLEFLCTNCGFKARARHFELMKCPKCKTLMEMVEHESSASLIAVGRKAVVTKAPKKKTEKQQGATLRKPIKPKTLRPRGSSGRKAAKTRVRVRTKAKAKSKRR